MKSSVPSARSPYRSAQDFQFSNTNNEFANSPNQTLHNKGCMPSADSIKQELNIFNNPTKGGNLLHSGLGMYKFSCFLPIFSFVYHMEFSLIKSGLALPAGPQKVSRFIKFGILPLFLMDL